MTAPPRDKLRLDVQVGKGLFAKPFSQRIYDRVERNRFITSPANGMPNWWVPVVLGTMARLRCGPSAAAVAIEAEQRNLGWLDDKARAALSKAVADIEVAWSAAPSDKPRN